MSRGATTATTRSPQRSSGTPTTSTSRTAGCDNKVASTSSGEDLLAAGVDGERAATVQHDAAVGIDAGEVARHRPAITVDLHEGRGGLLGIVVVPERQTPASRQPSHDAGAGLDRAEVFVEHRRAVVDREVRGRRRVLAGRAALVADDAGLRRAVPVDHHHRRQHLASELLRGRRAQRATGREADQRGEVPPVGVLTHLIDHRAHHRVTDERDEVDLLALHQVEDGFGVERPGAQYTTRPPA